MTNYKELIEELKNTRHLDPLREVCADAIEQLMRERDTAVDNLRGYVGCKLCKHFKTTVCLKKCRFGTCWEWRGVQE